MNEIEELIMIDSVTFTKDRFTFNKDEMIFFKPVINLIVGDQGVGKSTLLKSLLVPESSQHAYSVVKTVNGESASYSFFDFEKNNPRTIRDLNEARDVGSCLMSKFVSHGESNLKVLRYLETVSDEIVILDEPDQALSIRSCLKLCSLFKSAVARNCQIIAAVHNPIVIEAFDEVYDLASRKFVNSRDFVRSQYDGFA